MEDGLTVATKGIIDGGDISVATKGILHTKFIYWFGLIWREVISLISTVTNVFSASSPINGEQ